MEVQSLSICVPTHNQCVNKCEFCVSRTHTNPYDDRINRILKKSVEKSIKNTRISGTKLDINNFIENIENTIEYKDYFNRLQYARDNGCNVVVLTGTGEPIQNPDFLDFFCKINNTLQTPFKSIELQTTGVMLTDDVLAHLRQIGITTISFSISNIFDCDRNLNLIGCAEKLKFNVFETIKLVKKYDFNLRLSLNLVNDYDNFTVSEVINRCKELGADQVTFRKLYKSDLNNEIDKWIENNASVDFYDKLIEYVEKKGKFLGYLPFGPKIYDIDEMSVVVDDNCMSKDIKSTFKYLILRENAKLYFKWETKSSLIF
jgi:MoaA/NifB/PqqE/SkfB family radical SAM enzyme